MKIEDMPQGLPEEVINIAKDYQIDKEVFNAILNGDFQNLCGEYPEMCDDTTRITLKTNHCPMGTLCPYKDARERRKRLSFLTRIGFPIAEADYSVERIPEKLKTIADKYTADLHKRFLTGTGVTIGGDTGIGKTCGIAYIASKILEPNNLPVIVDAITMTRFTTASELLKVISNKNRNFGEERRYILDYYEIAPFLFIDGIGNENADLLLTPEFLTIFEIRYGKNYPTIISTDLTEEYFKAKKLAKFHDRLAHRNPFIWIAGPSQRNRASMADW